MSLKLTAVSGVHVTAAVAAGDVRLGASGVGRSTMHYEDWRRGRGRTPAASPTCLLCHWNLHRYF